ncbi:MAG: hypothetical protein ACJ763_19285 [Bdellovibrionia bacterium]
MKIGPFNGNVIFANFGSKSAVAQEDARADRDGGNGRDQYTRQQKKEGEGEGKSSPEDQKKKMEQALQSFKDDPQTLASGISAEAEGSGPGLRVIVKDSSGSVIRQFTGDEFMKLREAVSQDKNARGRLLDQKF